MSLKALKFVALVGIILSSVKLIEASQQQTTTTSPPPVAQASLDIQRQKVESVAEAVGVNSKQPLLPPPSSATNNGDKEQQTNQPNRQHTLIDESTSPTNRQSLVLSEEPVDQASGAQLFDTAASALLSSQAMPAGKRRFDTSPEDTIASQASRQQHHLSDRLAILELPNVDPAAFYRPDTLLAEAAANRERRKSKYSEIVDNGPGNSLIDGTTELGSLGQLELAAARNNRLAMASAMQYQKMAARKLRNQVKRPTGARAPARGGDDHLNGRSRPQARAFNMRERAGYGSGGPGAGKGTGIVRQESRKRVGGATMGRQQQGHKRGGADEWNEYDELDGRSDDTGNDGDSENETEADGGDGPSLSGPASSYRRRSGEHSNELELSSSEKSVDDELAAADNDEPDDDVTGAGRERAYVRRADKARMADDGGDSAADDQDWRQGRQLKRASSKQMIGSNLRRSAGGRGGRMGRKQGGPQSRYSSGSAGGDGGDDESSEDDDNIGTNSMKLHNTRDARKKNNNYMNGEGQHLRLATQLYADRRQSGPVYRNQKARGLDSGDDNKNVDDSLNYISSSPARRSGEQRFGSSPLISNDNNYDNNYKSKNGASGLSDNNNNNGNLADGDDSDLSASHVVRHSASDLQTAAGHHHGHEHGYYQYVEVPKKKAWKFGFKRGNHKHTIERHEKGHKNKFHTTFKWHAKEKCKKKSKCESVGKMSWDYKHHDKKHHYKK